MASCASSDSFPILAIEIVSENDTFEKLVKKVDRYRKCGTKEAWIFDIDSRRAFSVFR